MKEISFLINTDSSDLSQEDVLVEICNCESLSGLEGFFADHNIILQENPRYDKSDYVRICNALLNTSAGDDAKKQYSMWLRKVGNRIFTIDYRKGEN